MKKYYAVKSGSGEPMGIFFNWDDCRAAVDGVSGVQYKGFATLGEAEAFLTGEESAPKRDKAAKKEAPPPPDKPGTAIAYVDGSFSAESGEFSCGAVMFYNGEQLNFSRKYSDEDMASMRNVAGEIMGAVSVISCCLERGVPAVEIYHDYEGVAKWATGEWKTNKDGTRAYAEFCRRARERMRIDFLKVTAHSGDYWNDYADGLAKKALGI